VQIGGSAHRNCFLAILIGEEHMWQPFKRLMNWLVPEGQEAFRQLMAIHAQSSETNQQVRALRRDLADLALEVSQTKAGVSVIQGQTNEALTHIIVLRQELSEKGGELSGLAAIAVQLSETKAGVSAIQGESGEVLSHIIVLRRELSELGTRLTTGAAAGPPSGR
jgi:chromosome segregation ATPase